MSKVGGEERGGVSLTNLDQPLFDGAEATKRDLVDYLDAVAGLLIAELRDRPLSVVRVRPGQAPFMQKNVPRYTPPWVPTVLLWAESSRREVAYAMCQDRRTLLSSDSITSGLAISACDDLLYGLQGGPGPLAPPRRPARRSAWRPAPDEPQRRSAGAKAKDQRPP